MKIKKITKIEYKEDVYNLRIKTDEDEHHNYFANGLCVSNCHHAQNSSIKTIIVNCHRSKYKLGFTGTLPPSGSCGSFNLQSYIGPCVHKLTSAKLINDKNATPIHVECYELDYLSDDIKKKLFNLRNNATGEEGTKLLNLERNVMRNDKTRLSFICDKIIETNNNSLVLFNDVQGQYGKNIYNYIKEKSDKVVYYIDGSTKSDIRDRFKSEMEKNNDVIIVASMGTFSEGISINNLHNIFLGECGKSEIITAQILGRGMRLLPGKDKVIVYDFIDNYLIGGNSKTRGYFNYLYRHACERQLMYEKRKFPFKIIKTDLKNTQIKLL